MTGLFHVYTGGKYLPVYVCYQGVFYKVPNKRLEMLKNLDNRQGRKDFLSLIPSFEKPQTLLFRDARLNYKIRSFNADAL